MTKRLGMFLGLGFVGVVLLLGGLSWDAVAHANDPTLASREGIFTLRNPGHSLMGLGIGSVLVSLIGGCQTLLSSATTGRWARPGVQRAFLAVSTAVVLSAAAVTSWAAQAGHDEPAGPAGGHGRDKSEQLAASGDGSHGPRDDSGAAGVHSGDGAASATPAGDHPSASGAASHGGDADAEAASTSTSVVHDHVTDGPARQPASKSAGAGQDHAASTGSSRESAHRHDAGPSTGEPAGNHHAAPAAGPAAPRSAPPGDGADAPKGTWAEMRYGPFVVAPAGAGGDADHANVAVPSLPKPCSNCFLQEFEPDLVYADGSSANLDTGLMLHHAVMFSAGRPDPTCGPNEPFPGKLGQRFFASGNERTPGVFPPGFGYYVDSGNWSGIFHIMNHTAEPKTVFFQVKMRWSPASAGGVRPLTPIWLDMNNCRTSEYAVPAGPSSKHWTWTSTVTGRIVATAGHVHDGGIRTTLTNRTTGEHLCTSWAGWGTKAEFKGTIESMSGCTWDRVGTVKNGEILNLESVYNSSKPVPDAMGIMMAFVFETEDLGAGTPAPPEARGEIAPPQSTPPPSGHHEH
ncbi:MAG TPA: hypothetical protein VEG38_17715 [Acidimicrobiia bacterium]|nr:hypothetical protein [Acidimicrobiia bacterium]